MPSTLSEVARLAGVSLGTASSVLTKRKGHRVAAETAARVRHAADQLGYKPNRLARALATGKTSLIAFVDYDFGAAYSNRLARHFHRLLAADDHDLVVLGESTDPSAVITFADGAICTSRHIPNGLDLLLPLVQISPGPDTRQDALRLDLEDSACKALETFAQCGCQSVGFVGKVAELTDLDPRLVAYRAFVAKTGRTEILIDVPDELPANDYLTLRAFVAEHGWPAALFCVNEEVAIGGYRAIREARLRVGCDVAIIACDDVNSEFMDPPLSTLTIPLEEIGTMAWNLLRERMLSPEMPPRVIDVSANLVLRQSHLYVG